MKKLQTISIPEHDGSGTNFIVHYPELLPPDCTVQRSTLRCEQPAGRPDTPDVEQEDYAFSPWTNGNPSSLRTVVGGRGREFRIKQFLYDWAPPAAGLPSLWESSEIRPVETGGEVGWIGTDFKNHRAACMQRNGTQIEISVLRGEFSDRELALVLDGMIPVRNDHNATVRRTSFFDLSYWVRYRHEGLKVPHGLYRYNARHFFDKARRIDLTDVRSAGYRIPETLDHFNYNSSVEIIDEERSISELEILYRSSINDSDQIWFHIERENGIFPIEFPLKKDDHPAETYRTIPYSGREIFLASLDVRYGGYEAFWTADRTRVGMWTTSTRLTTFEGFQDIVAEVAAGI